jgi:Sec-independent protein translocase protein TatA
MSREAEFLVLMVIAFAVLLFYHREFPEVARALVESVRSFKNGGGPPRGLR